MRMEQLLYYLSVKHNNSFSKAADDSFMSQSSISKQIKLLEEELGGELFVRKRDSLELTDLGVLLNDHINQIVEEYKKICDIARMTVNCDYNIIRVGMLYYASYCGVIDGIVNFEHNLKDFHVQTVEINCGSMYSLLQSRKIDVAIGYSEFWPDDPEIEVIKLYSDSLAAVVNSRNPLSGCRHVNLEQLEKERFCFTREDPDLFEYLNQACIASGFTPLLTKSKVRLETISRYIIAGMRSTIYPMSTAIPFFIEPMFSILELIDAPGLTLSIMVLKSNQNQFCRAMIESLKDWFIEDNPKSVQQNSKQKRDILLGDQ